MLRNIIVAVLNVAKMQVAEIVKNCFLIRFFIAINVMMLSDFCDGDLFASHPLFSLHSSALQIILFYDDVEICNPLGSRTKKHKLGSSLKLIIILIW